MASRIERGANRRRGRSVRRFDARDLGVSGDFRHSAIGNLLHRPFGCMGLFYEFCFSLPPRPLADGLHDAVNAV